MSKRLFVLLAALALGVVACTGGGSSPAPATPTRTTAPATAAPQNTPAATTGAESPAATTGAESPAATTGAESPAATTEASPSPVAVVCDATAGTPATGSTFDPSSITGSANLGHWQSSDAENAALDCALQGFALTYPNVAVTNNLIAGDYAAQMVTQFGNVPPDLFYVNGEAALDWINQGFLLPLDDYISAQGFDMSTFYPGYQDTFKGPDGKTYGIAKDGNTIAMAYNTDLVDTAPTTLDELVTLATTLKTDNPDLAAPMCLNPGLDRGLAFLYAQGGELLNADGTAEAISTDASKAAVQWYMDLFKNGLGVVAPTGSWCGEQLGLGNVAIAFEGGWLKGAMDSTYPDINWQFAEMPQGSLGEPMTISYTAAYGIGADSVNKDQGWTVAQYLTGTDGMELWTSGGIAVPSRSDVPVPEGFDLIVAGAQYARPGSGFMPHYADVQKAFGDAFLAEVTDGTFSADTVVTATATAITTALSGGQ